MYRYFFYIIENNNGDVVVFDNEEVIVVIDSRGIYCFMYIGYLLGLELFVCGVCMDFLFNILIVDIKIKIVYMIN